uniref:G_PROTEIN_RECEP_F1_2 domain-containing protein n=1 Tax=Strongyloides venezuelensis TaxID=75913 RepID=A0A0K0F1T7_STRVS
MKDLKNTSYEVIIENNNNFLNPGSIVYGKVLERLLYFICIPGVIVNLIIFYKQIKTLKKTKSRSTTINLQFLSMMTFSDTMSLLCILFSASFNKYLDLSNIISTISCKINLFIIQTATAFSIWCWFVLSGIRYMAVFKPYTHLKLYYEPLYTTIVILFIICFFESKTVYNIEYLPILKVCIDTNEKARKLLNVIEIVSSYLFPFIFIFIMDIKILCWKRESTKTFGIIHKRSGNKWKIIRCGLFITITDLLMNLPSYTIRFYTLVIPRDDLNDLYKSKIFSIIYIISQVLYFSQFFLNCLYLYTIVYRSQNHSKKCKRSFS